LVQEATVEGHSTISEQANVAKSDKGMENVCVICLSNSRAWGFKHGKTVHMCACEGCVKTCFKERKMCPVCNMPADDIVQMFST
jgi:hypothetical protein